MRAEDLGIVLRDHPAVRLAVLNACHGARGSRRTVLAGVAQTLIRQGVPAVIAMQTRIRDDLAATLAQELYGALADGYPVDAGLAEARKAISEKSATEWGVPVLYLRAPDSRLFEVGEASGESPARPPGRRDDHPAWWRALLRPAVWAAGIAALPALVYALGLFALRSRETLLGLGEPLAYPLQQTVLTGLGALWWLPRNALLALVSGEPWLLAGSWGPLLAVAALSWVDLSRLAVFRRRPGTTRLARAVLPVLVSLLLLFAVRFYRAALFPQRFVDRAGPAFDVRPGGNRIESVAFEAVSWLENDSERNASRRQALAGLAGCLLVATLALARRIDRTTELARPWRRGLLAGCGLMALIVAGMVPRAHYRTSRFLADFYRLYRLGKDGRRGLRKDRALSEARRRSRGRGDPAQIWAAWVLVGDAR